MPARVPLAVTTNTVSRRDSASSSTGGAVSGCTAPVDDGTPTSCPGWEDNGEAIRNLAFGVDDKRHALAAVASSAIHDFNNALAAIMGHVSLARQTLAFDPKATGEDLEAALQACTNARKLLEYLLGYLARTQPAPVPIDLGRLVREAVRAAQSMAGPTARLTLEDRAQRMTVKGEPDPLFQAIFSLCLDATSNHASSPVHVHIVIRETDHPGPIARKANSAPGRWAEISITDNLSNPPSDVRKRKFCPLMEQIPEPDSPALAFPVVRRVIHDHGGAIRIEEDATISVLLPLA